VRRRGDVHSTPLLALGRKLEDLGGAVSVEGRGAEDALDGVTHVRVERRCGRDDAAGAVNDQAVALDEAREVVEEVRIAVQVGGPDRVELSDIGAEAFRRDPVGVEDLPVVEPALRAGLERRATR